MRPEEHFIGFRADLSTDIISLIHNAQSDDKSLKTLIQSTQQKEQLPPSIQKQYDKYSWEEALLW